MLQYCLKCSKNIESRNPKSPRTRNGRIKLLPKCALWHSKNTKIDQTVRS